MKKWEPANPVIVRVREGWMARTPDDHPYRIGVVAATEQEACERFEMSMAAWKKLHEQAQREQHAS